MKITPEAEEVLLDGAMRTVTALMQDKTSSASVKLTAANLVMDCVRGVGGKKKKARMTRKEVRSVIDRLKSEQAAANGGLLE